MTLSANFNAASTFGNYFPDNFTATQQTSAYVVPQNVTALFNTWKGEKDSSGTANKDKQFFLSPSGSTYKLSSASGSSALPDGAIPVSLDVAYAIQKKELSLTDWSMARMGDDFRRSNAMAGVNSILLNIPEADMGDALNSQDDVELMIKSLKKSSNELKSAFQLDGKTDIRDMARLLGVTAAALGDAMQAFSLFQAQAATLETGGSSDTTSDNFNELATSSYQALIQNFAAELEAAQAAFSAMAAAGTGSGSVQNTLKVGSAAMTSVLGAAADVAFMALYGNPSDVQQTSDGNVLDTASAAARQNQINTVEKALIGALEDPETKEGLVQAMKANAEALGSGRTGRLPGRCGRFDDPVDVE